MKATVYKSKRDGLFRWRLTADNGEKVDQSEGYHNQADAEHTLMLILNATVDNTEIEVES